MNLFCFTLDGSTDSLYEPTQSVQKSQDPGRLPRMPCSPSSIKNMAVWSGSEPCIAVVATCREAKNPSKTHLNKIHLEKAKRMSQIITASEDEATDHAGSYTHCRTNKTKDGWIHGKNDSKTEAVKDQRRSKLFAKDEKDERVCSEKTVKDTSVQGVNFEAWNPNRENCDGWQQDTK